jgi:hypothetical protein
MLVSASGQTLNYGRQLIYPFASSKEEEEEGPFNVLSVNVQHLLGRTVFFICDAYVALFFTAGCPS